MRELLPAPTACGTGNLQYVLKSERWQDMKIKVRLFATLRDGRGKELDIEMEEGIVVRKILEVLEIKQEDVALLLVNGRDGSFDAKLSDGDTVSMFPPVGGG